MSNDNNVRRKIKKVIREDIPDFEQFKKVAIQEARNLPNDLQKVVESAIRDNDFKETYAAILKAYEDAASDLDPSSESPTFDTIVKKARNNLPQNLKERGFDLYYKSKTKDGEKEKEFRLKIESKFLTALGALISKISGLF